MQMPMIWSCNLHTREQAPCMEETDWRELAQNTKDPCQTRPRRWAGAPHSRVSRGGKTMRPRKNITKPQAPGHKWGQSKAQHTLAQRRQQYTRWRRLFFPTSNFGQRLAGERMRSEAVYRTRCFLERCCSSASALSPLGHWARRPTSNKRPPSKPQPEEARSTPERVSGHAKLLAALKSERLLVGTSPSVKPSKRAKSESGCASRSGDSGPASPLFSSPRPTELESETG